jgi:adenylosuccinate lyase
LKVPEIAAVLSEAEIDDLLDPTNYVGLAPEFVDAITTNS